MLKTFKQFLLFHLPLYIYTEGDDTLTLAERCAPAMIRFPEAEVDSDKMDKRDYRTDISSCSPFSLFPYIIYVNFLYIIFIL